MGNIVGGDFALLDGDVNNFVRTSAIAHCIDMRDAGMHAGVCDDARAIRFNPGASEIQRGGIRSAAKGEENFIRRYANGFSALLEYDALRRAFLPGIHESCVSMKVNAFVA